MTAELRTRSKMATQPHIKKHNQVQRKNDGTDMYDAKRQHHHVPRGTNDSTTTYQEAKRQHNHVPRTKTTTQSRTKTTDRTTTYQEVKRQHNHVPRGRTSTQPGARTKTTAQSHTSKMAHRSSDWGK